MRLFKLSIMCLSLSSLLFSEPYQELVPGFNRLKSPVMIRKVTVPTLANLDYAAYDRNPVLVDPSGEKPKKKPKKMTIRDFGFKGSLLSPVQSIGKTPLTRSESDAGLAWRPLIKKAWSVVKNNQLENLASVITGYKWADPSVYQPYQEVTTAYLHNSDDGMEIWVKVELATWVPFFKGISDEDNDGVRELYGKLNLNQVDPDSLAKTIAWIRHDYAKKVLSLEQMNDWVTTLASYWYPTRNTDILDLDNGVWPDKRTPRKIRRALGGVTVSAPLAVIEGKPFSPKKPIYNVFIVDTVTFGAAVSDIATESKKKVRQIKIFDVALSDNFRKNNHMFAEEKKKYGSYPVWKEKNRAFFTGVTTWLDSFPEEQLGLEGSNGWLFFRKSFDYLLGGDLTQQDERTNPLPHIVAFKNYLAGLNIDLLFVVVPNKEEIYFDRISRKIPAPEVPLINPYGRKLLMDLQQAGVEVIDLLPGFLDEKKKAAADGDVIYQLQDTHWNTRGMMIAAKKIAERIRAYSWYQEIADTIAFRMIDTSFERLGDLAERVPHDRQKLYKPQTLRARQVIYPDGTRFKSTNLAAQVLLIGDSFTGVFELVDCKSAGVGAHIADYCRIPVDIITSWGGGPMVRQKMLRMRKKYLDRKRVVVYMMVARDLYNYSQGWEPLSSVD